MLKNKQTKQQIKQVTITPIKIGNFKLKIVGTSPMLQEKMAEKTMEALKNQMEGKGKDKKTIKDFEGEVAGKIHRNSKGEVCFPAGGFKKAIVEASPYLDGFDKKLAKSIVVVGDLVPIKYTKQVTNKTIGKMSGITKAPRPIWRPEFQNWSCELELRYNESLITPEQIVNLTKLAGFHIGVGGWTPQHNGSYGMFTVA